MVDIQNGVEKSSLSEVTMNVLHQSTGDEYLLFNMLAEIAPLINAHWASKRLHEANDTIRELRARLGSADSQLHIAEDHLHSLRKSISWRITAPLRIAKTSAASLLAKNWRGNR